MFRGTILLMFDAIIIYSRAKLKYCPYWPACIIKTPVHLKPKKKKTCVLFLATKNYGFIEPSNIVCYVSNRSTLAQKGKGTTFKEAVEKMDQYITNPQLFRENITIDPLNGDFEVKEEPDSDNEQESVELPNPTTKEDSAADSSNTKRNELLHDFSVLKAKNSSTFLELQTVKRANTLLQSTNESLKKQLTDAGIENQKMQTKITAIENENQKYKGLVEQLQKGISQRDNHGDSQNSNQRETKEVENETFEVEELLDHKKVGRKRCFLVRWTNYDSAHDQWIAEKDLLCPELLEEYLKSKNLS